VSSPVFARVLQQLQDVDEKRIQKTRQVIEGSATIENSVMPILRTCIDGINKAAAGINYEEVGYHSHLPLSVSEFFLDSKNWYIVSEMVILSFFLLHMYKKLF